MDEWMDHWMERERKMMAIRLRTHHRNGDRSPLDIDRNETSLLLESESAAAVNEASSYQEGTDETNPIA